MALTSDSVFYTTSSPRFRRNEFSDGTALATPCKLVRWDLKANKNVEEQLVGYPATRIHVDPISQMVTASGEEKGISVFNPDTSKPLAELMGHADLLLCFDFNQDGTLLNSVGRDGQILQHNIATTASRVIGRHDQGLTYAAISPDHAQLVTCDFGGNVFQWSLVDSKLVRKEKLVQGSPYRHIRFAEDSTTLSALTQDGTLLLWDLRTWVVKSVPVDKDAYDLRFVGRQNNVMVLCGSTKSAALQKGALNSEPSHTTIKLFDAAGKLLRESRLQGFITSAQFAPASNRLAVLNDAGILFLLNAETLAISRQIETKPTAYQLLPVGSDDRVVVARSENNTMAFDVNTGALVLNVPMQSTTSKATRAPVAWSTTASPKWWLLNDSQSILKVPRDIKSYAEDAAPWLLRN